jgi:hypothetical protein
MEFRAWPQFANPNEQKVFGLEMRKDDSTFAGKTSGEASHTGGKLDFNFLTESHKFIGETSDG